MINNDVNKFCPFKNNDNKFGLCEKSMCGLWSVSECKCGIIAIAENIELVKSLSENDTDNSENNNG